MVDINQPFSNSKLWTPAQPTSSAPKYRKGEKVRPLRKVDYDGRKLRQYDDVYTILDDVYGDRAVLTARGQIWAAMNVKDIERA